MRKVILIIMISFVSAVSLSAQSNQTLRDSLAKATDLLAYHPDSIDLRLKKTSWNILLEQWNYAKEDLDKVLFLDPNNIAGLYYRAFVNEKLGRLNFARLDYEHLLMLVPGNFDGQLGLALLNQKSKHFTEAFDQANSLVNQYPDSAVAYAARGGIEKERGWLELAIFDYSEAIRRDPSNQDYLLNRIDLLLSTKQNEAAIRDLDRLVSLGVNRNSLLELYIKAKK
ncbi:hypothetical protein JHU38_09120 [Prevotella sp. A2931]|uniref:Tetratricopeptide repeat protein n=1 Tax=Prevotella illustrans TaxID=2800387 RepID=A0ABS3M6W6_9BACT|nr:MULTISPECIES: hypothetical protein [Prevotella]MBO1363928.1 hypothetical protein [Prevotella illustrans]PTL25654.1 hypothetical protein C3V39_00325 [Prevotella sp. oral taxon 820]